MAGEDPRDEAVHDENPLPSRSRSQSWPRFRPATGSHTDSRRRPIPPAKPRVSTLVRLVAGSLSLAVGTLGLVFTAVAPGAQAVPYDASAAVTVNGGSAFPNLKVTVSQTQSLIDQEISINWTGAAPTLPGDGAFAVDYLQIMQCWGDNTATGPDRTQCQYGASGDGRGGPNTVLRQLDNGPNLVDPLETITTPAPPTVNYPDPKAAVPFDSVDGTVVPGDGENAQHQKVSTFFDSSTTNEIPFAPTAADGTGQVYFETETAREAPGLGCGQALKDPQGNTFGRPCWLVIVPRGDTEVNGAAVSHTVALSGLDSSPLSQSNWNNRIIVPLTFVPLTDPCAFGLTDRRTLGDEQMAEAMSHWQPTLCTANPVSYSFVENSDDLARLKLASDDPGLDFLSNPIPLSQPMPTGPPVYAPVALSGLAIGLDIESQARGSAPVGVRNLDGTRITQLNLTPRLVAKILTQSYKLGVSPVAPEMQFGGVLGNNPMDLTSDPDFIAANPLFKDLTFQPGIGDIMSPLIPSDATYALWQWINSDPAARAFLDGTPDPYGMIVNPNYKGLALPRADFPKQDPFCQTFGLSSNGNQPGPLCTLDRQPYTTTMHAGARGAARGDKLLKTTWNDSAPLGYVGTPAQPAGKRAILVITDTATANRYGLQTASLQNASGAFVAPTTDSLLASANSMVQRDGLAVPDPESKAAGAYPLTTLTYAATVPAQLTTQQGADYSTFLDYVTNGGQVPGVGQGQLPFGYVPLPQALHDQAAAVSKQIKALAGIPVSGPTTSGSSSPAPTRSSGPPYTLPTPIAGNGQVLNVQIPPHSVPYNGGTGSAPSGTRAAPSQGGGVITPSPSYSAPKKAGALTPLTPVGWIRFTLLVLLVIGGVLALAGPLLRIWAAKIPRRAIPPGVHLE